MEEDVAALDGEGVARGAVGVERVDGGLRRGVGQEHDVGCGLGEGIPGENAGEFIGPAQDHGNTKAEAVQDLLFQNGAQFVLSQQGCRESHVAALNVSPNAGAAGCGKDGGKILHADLVLPAHIDAAEDGDAGYGHRLTPLARIADGTNRFSTRMGTQTPSLAEAGRRNWNSLPSIAQAAHRRAGFCMRNASRSGIQAPDSRARRGCGEEARTVIGDTEDNPPARRVNPNTMREIQYRTPHGISVSRRISKLPYRNGLDRFLRDLDQYRGIYLSSGYDYPGRYSRWDIVSVRPPLELVSFERDVTFRPLNERGVAINKMIAAALRDHEHWEEFREEGGTIHGRLKPMAEFFSEEERSRQPSVFSVLRALTHEFRNDQDDKLALAGAFGYDLLFQFEPIPLHLERRMKKDLQLFLCDDIIYMDRKREVIERFTYEFSGEGLTTEGLKRTGTKVRKQRKRKAGPITSDHTPEEYMANVEKVRAGMKRGDYYEVVLRQTFKTPYSGKASDLFRKMQDASPSPYEFLLQFDDEQLVGASPEMFVRVEGRRVETCPISGTAKRTSDPLQNAHNIRELLNSPKEESELTMCTDVDRNDKSRVCVPGTVQVLERRLIEKYSGLYHTVDHVVGTLAENLDSLDAFLSHMWAVTLIGAPKKAASVAIESYEKSARDWYGGAVGMLTLNGDINTGIAIRTTYLRDGYATYPAGATLLYDSEPAAEEAETRLKANGFFRILGGQKAAGAGAFQAAPEAAGRPKPKLLLVDNDDCFIHTLANYARQAGADVVTYRAGMPFAVLDQAKPDLVLISPGPGRPQDFGVPALVRHAAAAGIPVFGVCLGLQGVVEAFGGELGVLAYPMHGKPSKISHGGKGVFEGLPETIEVGRYHSLYAIPEKLPEVLEVTAMSEDGVIMGVRHRQLPVEAVQFHPESILTAAGDTGLILMRNALRLAGRKSG